MNEYEDLLERYGCPDLDMDSLRVAVVDSKTRLAPGVIAKTLPYDLIEVVMARGRKDKTLRSVCLPNADVFDRILFLTLAEQKTREDALVLPIPSLSVVTTKTGVCGAGVLALPEVFSELAEQEESDLYLLPSSMHEVLVAPVNGYNCDAEEILSWVRTVNGDPSMIKGKDILCNAVFLFRRKTQRIEKVAGD